MGILKKKKGVVEMVEVGSRPQVSIVRCPLEARQEEVTARLRQAIDLLGGMPEAIRSARGIVVKPNYVGIMFRRSVDEVAMYQGRHAHCTEPAVTEATVALIREANPTATIYVGDGLDRVDGGPSADELFHFMRADRLAERYGARVLDLNEGDTVRVPVSDGLVARWLWVRREVAEADTFVSVAKLKCHQTAGITLTTKNMFGLLPRRHYGSVNRGFMHQNGVRLMRMFVDINATFRQSLSIVDGIVGTNHGMDGPGYPAGVLLAGTNHVATDAVAARLMGMDPTVTFPHAPFLISENHILLAHQRGLGPVALAEIDQRGEPLSAFNFHFETHPEEGYTSAKAAEVLQAARAQAELYHAGGLRDTLLETHRGQFVFLVDGQVKAAAPTIAAAQELDYFDDGVGYGYAVQVLPPDEQVEQPAAYSI